MSERETYPGLSYDEELKARAWEQLPAGEKAAQIEKARLERVHWGKCQRCQGHIEATGANWPSACPHCGFGAHDGE